MKRIAHPDFLSSRRRFLSMVGSTAVALPFASMLLRHHKARAQALPAPLRFVVVYSPHGCALDLWQPRSSSGGVATVSDFSFDFPNSSLLPLQNWRDKLVVLEGVDFRATYEGGTYGGHEMGMSTCTTGAVHDNMSSSIDQYIAQRMNHSPLRSLEVGVGLPGAAGPNAWNAVTLCWDERGYGVTNLTNPLDTFQLLFGNFIPPDNGGEEELARLLARKRSVLDFALSDTEKLRDALAGREREKLEAHLTSLRQIEQRLSGTNVKCSVPSAPQNISDYENTALHDINADLQLELISQAFLCDITRVASMKFHFSGHDRAAPYMNSYTNFAGGDYAQDLHNKVAHQFGTNVSDGYRVSEVTHYFASKVEKLLESLNVPDPLGDGSATILDNTVILWTSCLGNPAAHHNIGVPMLVLGGGGGSIRTGQYLKVRNGSASWDDFDSQYPHNKVLTSMCHAMGYADVSHFGDGTFAGHPDYQGTVNGLLV